MVAVTEHGVRVDVRPRDEDEAALEIAASEGLDGSGWAAAERSAHQLAGSAGTFGYAAASDRARSLERLLGEASATGSGSPNPAALGEARQLLVPAGPWLAGANTLQPWLWRRLRGCADCCEIETGG